MMNHRGIRSAGLMSAVLAPLLATPGVADVMPRVPRNPKRKFESAPIRNHIGKGGMSKRDKHRAMVASRKPHAPGPKFVKPSGKKRSKFSLPTHGRTNPLAMLRIER